MQTQDAPAEIIFKLWPWLEANQKRLIAVAVAIVAYRRLVLKKQGWDQVKTCMRALHHTH